MEINDAAISDAFNLWLANMNNQAEPPKWFCAVSFINPHDMSDFPYTFGLTAGVGQCPIPSGNTEPYCGPIPAMAPAYGYQPPPSTLTSQVSYNGTDCLNGPTACATDTDITTVKVAPTSYTGALMSGSQWLTNWNWEDQSGAPYSSTGPNYKPGLQQAFQTQRNNDSGGIASPSGNHTAWETFLNYYLWLESCVDYQIGQVLGTNPGSTGGLKNSNFWTGANGTVIIFTADHGDYGGSHGIHAKGGALYDEVINVPLFISYPECRGNWPNPPDPAPPALPYTCSAVDILPFLYTLALGNDTWRVNPNDIVYYLRGRESIMDAIMLYNGVPGSVQVVQQRRISDILLHTPLVTNPTQDWQRYQPFVLHTADDISIATDSSSNYHPSHAIAFRTVDQTDPVPVANQPNGATKYGGGKLGIYCYWDTCHATNAPITYLSSTSGSTPPYSEFEFYNYSNNPQGGDVPKPGINVNEVGNAYLDGTAPNEAALYTSDFFATNPPNGINVQHELYINSYIASPGPQAQVYAAIQTAFHNYIMYLQCTGQLTLANGSPAQTPNSSSCPSPANRCPNCETSQVCPPPYAGGA